MDASKNGYGTIVTSMLCCVPGSLRLCGDAAPGGLHSYGSCGQIRGWAA
ncbi:MULTISPECIES: hypothetical protein [Actinomyces]|nr:MULTISPECIES: hypothetical protein [Actinomyces]